jgi:trigger factor
MQVTVEAINSVTKKINIEIPVEQVDTEIEKVYAGIQKTAKMQGFRVGKAPLQLIKRTYSDSMRKEVMRRFYDQTLFKAMNEQKIEPVDSPTIESDILEQGNPFKYSAVVETMPEILLQNCTDLAVAKEKYILNPDSIEAELKRMQGNMAQLVPLDEGSVVENGHVVSVDYSFTVADHPEENSTAEDSLIEVGANQLLPEFEEQLIGMKSGEEKEVRVTLPDGYPNPEVVGKEGIFLVTLKEIKRKEIPALDDEFAQQAGEFETMEQLRSKMMEYHQKKETERIDNKVKEEIIQALIEKNPLDVPQSMIKRQLDDMFENFKKRLKSQRMSIEMMGLDEEKFRLRFRDSAQDKIKGGLLLMALIEKENITVNDEELAQHYEQIAEGNADMLVRVKEHYSTNRNAQNSLIAEIKEDKAIHFLLNHAVITEVEAAQQETA